MKRQVVLPLVLMPLLMAMSVPTALAADESNAKSPNQGQAATRAQDQADAAPPAETGEKQQPLSAKQLAASARYERFEKDLLRLFEYMRKTDPDRADLLERAYKLSREDQIAVQMRQLVTMLKQGEFGTAVERQDEIVQHLGALLELLQSEDRMSEIEREKKRIEALLKDVNRTIGKEKVVRSETEKGGDPERLAGRQSKVAKDTKGIIDKIDKQDGKSSEGKPSEGNPREGKPSEGTT